ncbi:flagellar hook capping FlgD N-terminal domain-containing protein [Erythrobacter sp. THAF29]|uniref:flagellar hook capping FlgD N-terminal domain-containing protein n=1 Tax=Erythrobacter sp. THAF29 TaxID=2587851 RepID=UPI00126986F4|nr:flagellar hook capping FlgD N-terminal domain-containing protein [Erythrobacter sp. THAF29]QFT76689.1 Basal-body rod modification protein FlgD [Erythrobacter sp. THAF29]
MENLSNLPVSPGVQSTLDRLNAPSNVRASNGLGSLDQADFLRLLTTQLAVQDPLEPVNNEEMLAQMAQFSSLAASTASSQTLDEISAKLDDLIAAQEAALEASRAAAAAAASAAQAAGAPSTANAVSALT